MACSLNKDWPSILPSCETASKSRNQPQGYKFNDVNSGPPFQELFTSDLPTFWDVTFKFTRDNARIFIMWLNQNNYRENASWFKFPIQLEEGLTTQEVRFLTYPQATGQNGDAFSYSAKIMARDIVSKDKTCPEGSLYILLNKSCNSTFEKAANCFGSAFDDAWPATNPNSSTKFDKSICFGEAFDKGWPKL